MHPHHYHRQQSRQTLLKASHTHREGSAGYNDPSLIIMGESFPPSWERILMNTTQGFSVRQETQLSSTGWLHCWFPCSPFRLADASLMLTHFFYESETSSAEQWWVLVTLSHRIVLLWNPTVFTTENCVLRNWTARRDVIVHCYSQSWGPYAVFVTSVWTHSETSINHPDGKQSNTSTPNSILLDSNFLQIVPSSNASGASAIATLHTQIILSLLAICPSFILPAEPWPDWTRTKVWQ